MDSIKYNKKIVDYGTITSRLSPADQLTARKMTFEILKKRAGSVSRFLLMFQNPVIARV